MADCALSDPQPWWSEPCVLGVDEAGRGPVLGPLVYAAAFCALSKYDEVKKCGFADSKTLNEEKREALESALKADSRIGWIVDVISAHTLSTKMLGRARTNLNQISFDSAIGMVQRAIAAGVNVVEVYVDTVGDPKQYTERLERAFTGVRCLAAVKADALYPVVSAASIVAKVTRDARLRDWVFPEQLPAVSRDWGCGYPSDVLTQQWLEGHRDAVFGFPSVVRFSWATTKRSLDTEAVPVEWEVDLEEEGGSRGGGAQQRLQFAPARAPGAAPVAKRHHPYFKSRKLTPLELGR